MKDTTLKFGRVVPKVQVTTSKAIFNATPKATTIKSSGTPRYTQPAKINRPTYTP